MGSATGSATGSAAGAKPSGAEGEEGEEEEEGGWGGGDEDESEGGPGGGKSNTLEGAVDEATLLDGVPGPSGGVSGGGVGMIATKRAMMPTQPPALWKRIR